MVASSARVRDLLDLADEWERLGLVVRELAGWETRGRDDQNTFDVFGAHHTGATVDVDRLLIEGRPRIPGPLANVALHADGTAALVAAGRANHFGVATWPSGRALGVEATGPPFPNYRHYVLLAAGFCRWKRFPPTAVARGDVQIPVHLVAAHKEVAIPYGRKPNPAFPAHPDDRVIAGVTLIDHFRADVAAAMLQEDDMTSDEFVKTIPVIANQVAEQVAADLDPKLRKYQAVGGLLVKHPDHPHVFKVVDAAGGRLVWLQSQAIFNAHSGGRPVSEAVVVLPAGDPLLDLPVSGLDSKPWE